MTGLIVRLLLLYRAVVIYKHESAVILGIDVTGGTLIPRAEVAFGVVIGESGLGRALLRSSSCSY